MLAAVALLKSEVPPTPHVSKYRIHEVYESLEPVCVKAASTKDPRCLGRASRHRLQVFVEALEALGHALLHPRLERRVASLVLPCSSERSRVSSVSGRSPPHDWVETSRSGGVIS